MRKAQNPVAKHPQRTKKNIKGKKVKLLLIFQNKTVSGTTG